MKKNSHENHHCGCVKLLAETAFLGPGSLEGTCLKQGQIHNQLRVFKALSCQVLRGSRDGACPASLASLSAWAFPSLQLECLLVQRSLLFLTMQHWWAWLCLLDALPRGCYGSPWTCPSSRLNKPSSLRHLLWPSWQPLLAPSPVCWGLAGIWGLRGGGSVVLQPMEWTEGYNLFPQSSSCAPLGAVPEPTWLPGPTAQSLDWTGNYISILHKIHKGKLIISYGKPLHKSLVEATLRYKFTIAITVIYEYVVSN